MLRPLRRYVQQLLGLHPRQGALQEVKGEVPVEAPILQYLPLMMILKVGQLTTKLLGVYK